jgi:glutathione S-transferase
MYLLQSHTHTQTLVLLLSFMVSAMPKSGNCYKVAWALRRLGIPYEMIHTTFIDGGTKKPEFLEKNPNGQVPLLELDDGHYLAESNAILLYIEENKESLVTTTTTTSLLPSLIPSHPYQRALMYQWMCFEQYSHEPFIAVRRANILFQRPCSKETMDHLLERGYHALNVMEQQLTKSSFMVGEEMTLADIALFAYTHVAQEGGYDLSTTCPNILNWLQRVQDSIQFFGMDILEETKNSW